MRHIRQVLVRVLVWRLIEYNMVSQPTGRRYDTLHGGRMRRVHLAFGSGTAYFHIIISLVARIVVLGEVDALGTGQFRG